MKVLIVEDEVMAQQSLLRMLNRLFPEVEVVGMCRSVEDTVRFLEDPEHRVDLIFMDVELSDGVCFEIFKRTDVKAKVVMTTAYDTYAIKAFEAGSVDYLLKPIDPDALRRAVGRCKMSGGVVDVNYLVSKFMSAGQAGAQEKKYKERYIVRFNDRIVPVEVSDIAYIYSEEKNNYMVTFQGVRYVLDCTLDVICDELDPVDFFRISRGVIVSLKCIKSIIKQIGGRLKIVPVISSEIDMTVSRPRVEDYMKWLEK